MLTDVTIWESFERMASEFDSRPCIVTSRERKSYAEVHGRAVKMAAYLHAHGMGCHTPRSHLADWESGQDHLALYLGSDAPYVEAMLGALRSRVAPMNINYRYVAAELLQVLRDSAATGIVFDADLAPLLAEVLPQMPTMKALIQVGEGELTIPGAVRYEDVVASQCDAPSDAPAPDDLCIVCTGGTTGFPKAVLWRQADLVSSMTGWVGYDDADESTRRPAESVDDLVETAGRGEQRLLIGPALIHFGGLGNAMRMVVTGGTIVLADPHRGMDAASMWRMVQDEAVQSMVVVGDAFCRPLLDELQAGDYDTSSLEVIRTGGASTSPEVKQALQDALGEKVVITEGFGASESPSPGQAVGTHLRAGVLVPGPMTGIVSDDRTRAIDPSEQDIGWLAVFGTVPLGYLDHSGKTAETFPVIDGRRCAIPGDRARWLPDGSIEFFGREANTINSGGEKIYAAEVERALLQHSDVSEALVVGRRSERWGEEVVGIVVLDRGSRFHQESILAECGRQISRYKVPKDLVVVEALRRTNTGKADYEWARKVVSKASLR